MLENIAVFVPFEVTMEKSGQRLMKVFPPYDLGFDLDGSNAFWPFEGGTLELSGVFGGRPSLASSSATRAVSAATCATNVWISASFCSCESNERSGPADMDPWI